MTSMAWRAVSAAGRMMVGIAWLVWIASVATPASAGSIRVTRLVAGSGLHATSVGFRLLDVRNGGEPPLRVGIWYPSSGRPTDQPLEDFTQRVAVDGPLFGRDLPLIVISHGGGGSLAGHYDTALALAKAGFVVAAVNHHGDMVGDQSKVLQLWRRPQQLRRVVTYMLSEWSDHARIDGRKVGAYGFSNGGFTALVAAGGVPNLGLIDPYCQDNPLHDLCTALREAGVRSVAALPVPDDAWRRDDRIRAIAVAAPGFGPVFAHGGLRGVTVPVQLWFGTDDRHQPGPWYDQVVLRELPHRPEVRAVEGAGHYDFLAPCTPGLRKAVPLICAEKPGFDRITFHDRMNADLVRFFRRSLSAPGGKAAR